MVKQIVGPKKILVGKNVWSKNVFGHFWPFCFFGQKIVGYITDGIVPADFQITSVTPLTDSVAGAWNSHNTGATVPVALVNDASLEGGEIYILGRKVGVDTWQVLGDYGEAIYDLSADELAAGQSIVPSSSDLLEDIETQADGDTWPDGVEEMDNFEEGVSLAFSARVYDVARNYTDFNYDYTPLVVDTTSPEIQNVTSLNTAKAYGAGETIYISVKTNEQMRAVGGTVTKTFLI